MKYSLAYRINAGELFGNGWSREIHDANLIQRVFTSRILIRPVLRSQTWWGSFWTNTEWGNREKVSMALAKGLLLSMMRCMGRGSPSFWNLLSRASACPASEQKLGWVRMSSCTAELILRWSNNSVRARCTGGSLKSSLYSSSHVWTKANRGLRRKRKSHYILTIWATL